MRVRDFREARCACSYRSSRRLGWTFPATTLATLNLSIAPARYQVTKPRLTFRNVKWHPTERRPEQEYRALRPSFDLKGKIMNVVMMGWPRERLPETYPEGL
jgi:hypothetical protein